MRRWKFQHADGRSAVVTAATWFLGRHGAALILGCEPSDLIEVYLNGSPL